GVLPACAPSGQAGFVACAGRIPRRFRSFYRLPTSRSRGCQRCFAVRDRSARNRAFPHPRTWLLKGFFFNCLFLRLIAVFVRLVAFTPFRDDLLHLALNFDHAHLPVGERTTFETVRDREFQRQQNVLLGDTAACFKSAVSAGGL